MTAIIAKKFGRKSEDILRNAMLAFDAGYAWPVHDIEHMPMAPGENDAANRISTDGNTMIALGLIAGRLPLRRWIPHHSVDHDHGVSPHRAPKV